MHLIYLSKNLNSFYKCKKHLIEIELKYAPEINRISFLESILDSSLITNEQYEAYEVCSVIRDMKKQLTLDT